MAITTFTSYDAVGLKEDVSDIITNITPTKTPFQTVIGREKVTQRWFQWQEDSLRSVGSNAQVEGFASSALNGNMVSTVLRNNTTQILGELVTVTGSMDASSTYGRARETAYQMSKAAMQVKRDLENALVGGYQASAAGGPGSGDTASSNPQNAYFAPAAGTGSGTARTFANVPALIDATGAGVGGASAAPAGANVVVIDGPTTGYTTGTSLLTEAKLLVALQNCYTNGAEPNTIMVTPQDSVAVAAFASAAGRYRQFGPQGDSQKLVNAINLYVSPFGEQKVVLNRFLHNSLTASSGAAAGTAWTLVFDPSMWALVTFRSWFREVLAKQGDYTAQMIVGEFSLKHKNFQASSAIVQGASTLAAANSSAGW